MTKSEKKVKHYHEILPRYAELSQALDREQAELPRLKVEARELRKKEKEAARNYETVELFRLIGRADDAQFAEAKRTFDAAKRARVEVEVRIGEIGNNSSSTRALKEKVGLEAKWLAQAEMIEVMHGRVEAIVAVIFDQLRPVVHALNADLTLAAEMFPSAGHDGKGTSRPVPYAGGVGSEVRDIMNFLLPDPYHTDGGRLEFCINRLRAAVESAKITRADYLKKVEVA